MSVVVESQSLRIERIEQVGNWALSLFFLTAWVAPGAANLALLTMLVCCLLTPRVSLSAWSRMPIFWLVVAWNLYLGLRLGLVYIETPEQFGVHLSATADFLKLGLFFIVGWWARGDERKIKLLLLLALVGIILNTLKRVDWDTLSLVLSTGRRTGFGVQIPMAALLSGAMLIGLVCLQQSITTVNNRLVWGRSIIWLIAIAFSAVIVLYTQTRTIWLALVLLVPVILLTRMLKPRDLNLRYLLPRVLGLIGITALVLLGLWQLDTVSARLEHEYATVLAILDPDQQVAGGSVGVRYHAFILGWDRWLEQLWLGWGAGYDAAKLNPAYLPSYLNHLHNTYLEVLVRFGVVGSAILLAGVIWLHVALFRSVHVGRTSFELALVLISLELVFAIWSFTDFQIMRGYCQMYWFVVGGLMLAIMSSSVSTHVSQSGQKRESYRV